MDVFRHPMADTAIDYEELTKMGAMMGSGGMVVLDDSDCMVDMAKYFLTFTHKQSCGKCTFCRIGTKHMLNIVTRLSEGKAYSCRYQMNWRNFVNPSGMEVCADLERLHPILFLQDSDISGKNMKCIPRESARQKNAAI